MRTMSVKEARINFGHMINMAEKGETVVITRNGKEAAIVCAVPARPKALTSLGEFRARITRPKTGLAGAVISGRREERY